MCYKGAPYNFVPQQSSDEILTDKNVDDICHDRFYTDKYSGWLDVKWMALTPIYTRGESSLEQFRDEKLISAFYGPSGIPALPGSSLRGMIRSFMNIICYGEFGPYTPYHFWYRKVAQKNHIYQKKMWAVDNGKLRLKMKAGFLNKKSVDGKEVWFIRQAPEIAHGYDRLCYYYEPKYEKNYGPEPPKKISIEIDRWERQESARPFPEISYLRYRGNIDHRGANSIEAWLIKGGHIGGKNPKKAKHYHRIILSPKEDSEEIEVPRSLVDDYREDKQRSSEVPDLLKLAKDKYKYEHGVPCFYLLDKDKKVAGFGHTEMFRLRYDLGVGDLAVKKSEEKLNEVDISTAIFGRVIDESESNKNEKDESKKEKSIAGRVFFEDATLCSGHKMDQTSRMPSILTGPKPTYTAHYLENKPDCRKDYNRPERAQEKAAQLRGHKRYWHRKVNGDWQAVLRLSDKDIKNFDSDDDFKKYLQGNIEFYSLTMNFGEGYKEIERRIKGFLNSRKIRFFDKPGKLDVNLPADKGNLVLEIKEKIDIANKNNSNKIRFICEKNYLINTKDLDDNCQDQKKYRNILNEIQKSQYTLIQTMPEDSSFKGRIYFENLDKVELGALIACLELPEGCAHKFGMGKPLGLGSIKSEISGCELFCDPEKNSLKWYDSWESGTEKMLKEDFGDLKNSFYLRLLQFLQEENKDNKNPEDRFYDLGRMKELKALLDWENSPNHTKTRYMEIEHFQRFNSKAENEFKNESALPRPTEVKRGDY